jgi:hypothetical protein
MQAYAKVAPVQRSLSRLVKKAGENFSIYFSQFGVIKTNRTFFKINGKI